MEHRGPDADAADAQSDRGDAHVLDRGVGEEALVVVRAPQEQRAHGQREDARQQQYVAYPADRFGLLHDAIDAENGQKAGVDQPRRDQRRGGCRRGEIGVDGRSCRAGKSPSCSCNRRGSAERRFSGRAGCRRRRCAPAPRSAANRRPATRAAGCPDRPWRCLPSRRRCISTSLRAPAPCGGGRRCRRRRGVVASRKIHVTAMLRAKYTPVMAVVEQHQQREVETILLDRIVAQVRRTSGRRRRPRRSSAARRRACLPRRTGRTATIPRRSLRRRCERPATVGRGRRRRPAV